MSPDPGLVMGSKGLRPEDVPLSTSKHTPSEVLRELVDRDLGFIIMLILEEKKKERGKKKKKISSSILFIHLSCASAKMA